MARWSKHGAMPQLLPMSDVDDKGQSWTDLANDPAAREACGWAEAGSPQEISRMQARVFLASLPSISQPENVDRCLLDDVDAFVGQRDRQTVEYWNNVSVIHRDHSLVEMLTSELGWSEEYVNDLFTMAKLIE